MSANAETPSNVVALPKREPAAAGVVGPIPVQIEERIYDVAFSHYDTVRYGRDAKIVMTFKIVTVGSSYFGVKVPKWYRVRWVAKHRRKNGQFKVGYHSDFLADYTLLFGRPPRLDRLSLDPWRTSILQARVETVTTDSRQRAKQPELRYSVIRQFIGAHRG
jgi:hypothetical protein